MPFFLVSDPQPKLFDFLTVFLTVKNVPAIPAPGNTVNRCAR
jgi:hypothetical protein